MRLSEKMAGQRDNWNILQWYMAFPQRDMLDEWIPEVAKLEAENEALGELLSPLVDVELERDKLKAENAALREYITHKPGCNVYYAVYERDAKPVCNCGFDALLTEEKPETPISDVPITP